MGCVSSGPGSGSSPFTIESSNARIWVKVIAVLGLHEVGGRQPEAAAGGGKRRQPGEARRQAGDRKAALRSGG